MRSTYFAPTCGVLILVAACGSSEPESNGEITSQADVQRFFEAVVPDLVEAFTQLANQQSSPGTGLFSDASKGGGNPTSTVFCPGGGTLVVDLITGQATLSDCSAGGVMISGTVGLFVTQIGPSSYQATFSGTLVVTGSFNGTVEVNQAFVQWTDPPSAGSTIWDATVTVNGMVFIVSSEGSSDVCPRVELNDFSGPPGAPCDDASDCQANSCRDPISNPSEGCTCRNLDGPTPGDCSACIGVNAAPPGAPEDPATECSDAGDFSCSCMTLSGQTTFFSLSAGGTCVF